MNAKLREKLIDEILKSGDYLEDRVNENETKIFEKVFLFFVLIVIVVGLIFLPLF